MLNPGMMIGGRYEIEEKIGIGGMAVVYKAKDHKLGREVAIKVLKQESMSDETALARFRKEGQAAASLSHNNIVGVYDLGQDQGSDYLVMEYIDGMTLKEYIRRREKLSNEEIFKISLRIADALKCAHANGLVHRDIKPQNIMVTPKGAVKVTDFGIAKATGMVSSTAAGEAMGSVHYFSPEQARGRNVDARSDLYSMGITMFEMATSRIPFDGDTPVAVAMKHLHDPLPEISQINPDVWPGLIAIIKKLTNKQPEERYQDAETVIEDLKKVYRDHQYQVDASAVHTSYVDPQATGTIPQVEEPEEEKKRSKVPFIIAGVVGAALILGVILFLLLSKKPEDSGVPNVLGMTEEEALEICGKTGYYLEVEAQGYSNEYAAGTIMSQSPEAGTPAEKDTPIRIEYSMGPFDASSIPNLVGQAYELAVTQLIDLGIPYTVETEASTEVKMGEIIRQEPEAGGDMQADTEMVIYVSIGAAGEGIPVPNLVGKSREEAADMLKEVNLTLGEVSLSYHETVPAGQIIAQDLDPNSQVTEGTSINVTISQGIPSEEENDNAENGLIVITNPLSSDKKEGQLSVEAVDGRGNSTGLYDRMVDESVFADGGLEISYPSGTVKIHVYLDGVEVLTQDIN